MLRGFYALAAIGGILGLCLGFLGSLHPAFDTFSHFRWHFALILLALAILGLVTQVKRAPFILMLFAVIGVWQSDAGNRLTKVHPVLSELSDTRGNSSIRLLHYNLRFDNKRMDDVLAMIGEIDADVLSLNETSRQWMSKLDTLKTKYPYSFHCPEWNRIGGTMLFSKFAMRSDKNYCHAYAALGMTEISIGGDWMEIGTVHMRWPWPASGPKQLATLLPKLKTIGSNAIITGDFNAVPWSHSVQKFAATSGMNVATGFGGTWMIKWLPTTLAPLLGLPIDNAMAKGRIIIANAQTLKAIGSDHLPLLVTFQLKANDK